MLFFILLICSANLYAEIIRLTCTSSRVVSLYKHGSVEESENNVTSSVLIDSKKSLIKMSSRNETINHSVTASYKIYDTVYDEAENLIVVIGKKKNMTLTKLFEATVYINLEQMHLTYKVYDSGVMGNVFSNHAGFNCFKSE